MILAPWTSRSRSILLAVPLAGAIVACVSAGDVDALLAALSVAAVATGFAYASHTKATAHMAEIERLLRSSLDSPQDIPPDLPPSLNRLADLATDVASRVAVLEAEVIASESVAKHDPLTGLPNLLYFEANLSSAVARVTKDSGEFALLSLDLDGFKPVNDTFGHAAGDAVLCEIAHLLRRVVDDAFIGRVGGDEFAVVQTGRQQPDAALELAQRIQEAVASRNLLSDVPVGVCIGVSVSPRDGCDAVALRQAADVALYRAKSDGRSCTRLYDNAPRRSPEADAPRAARALQRAIERGELRLFYQPKMRARTNLVEGAEALVRWQHPSDGLIPPDQFIPLAARSGLIGALTRWTLQQAVRDQKALDAAGHRLPVYINLSGRLLSDSGFVADALNILGGAAGQIGLEITETEIIEDGERALCQLEKLASAGLRLSIDDYGSGLSSLSYLKRLPAHELKIDRAFVSEITRSHRDPLLVRSTIDLAHALGMEVTAEGVETASALALLTVMGCDFVQGYLISRPLPFDAFVAFLEDNREPLRFEKPLIMRRPKSS